MGIGFTKKKSRKKDSNFGLPPVVGGSQANHSVLVGFLPVWPSRKQKQNGQIQVEEDVEENTQIGIPASEKNVHPSHCTWIHC